MDSITQFALGAAVGEAAAGHRLGRRALLWGGLAGTLPDLDVLLSPFQTAAEALHFHRGPTHSLFFAFAAAPLLGWLVSRLYRHRRPDLARAGPWIAVFFWAMWTHPMLDYFTIYGTQLFWPLTDRPYALGSIFIVDLLFSLPLFVVVGRSFFLREAARRRRLAWRALVWGAIYLAAGVGIRLHVAGVMRDGLAREGVEARRLLTMTSPFNTILWYGIAETDSGFVATTYGLLDGNRDLDVQHVPRRAELLAPLAGEPAIETLRWFSQGYWSMAEGPDGLHLRDVRFGRRDGWLTGTDSGYVFDFRLIRQPGGTWTFAHDPPAFDLADFQRLLKRIAGEEP